MLVAATQYLLTRAEIFEAQRAVVWLTGSLNGRGWDHVRTVGIAMLILVPIVVALSGRLKVMLLGDDAAKGLGVPVERSRLALVIVAVALAAMAVAAAGPIVFVAFVAAPIARRLTRTPAQPRRRSPRRSADHARVRPRRPPAVRPDRAARRRRSPASSAPRTCCGCWPGRTGWERADEQASPRASESTSRSFARWCLRERAPAGSVARLDGAPVSKRNGDQPTLAAEDLCLAYDDREVVADLSVTIPSGQITVIVGTQRLRQVDPAAGAGPAAQAAPRRRAARRQLDPQAADARGRHPPRHPAAVTGRPRGHHRRRPGRPRPLPAPGLVPPVDARRPGRRRRRAGRHRHARPRRTTGRRALGRPAPAGLDRHDARPGHRR